MNFSQAHKILLSGNENQRVFSQTVVLEVEKTDKPGPKWVQIAKAGVYLGYRNGVQPFSLNENIFNQMVKNIRSHPSFKADLSGLGTDNVIPWDFNHASEMNPTNGTLPEVGAPSQGWTLDLQVRTNIQTNEKELWALTQFLEPASGYVKEGKYRWASIACTFDAVDGKSCEEVGAIITSIALTNTPFLEGMSELVASKNLGRIKGASLRRHFYDSAESPEEAISYFKELFGIPELSSVQDVLSNLQKLDLILREDEVIPGVDKKDLISSVRKILNLPALMDDSSVVKHAVDTVTKLVTEKNNVSVEVPNLQEPNIGGSEMDELLKALAGLLGVRANEDSVTTAVQESADLRKETQTVLCVGNDSNKAILAKASELIQDSKNFGEMLVALGVDSPEKAAAMIADLVKDSATLKKVQPEIDKLKKQRDEDEAKDITHDVEAAMASKNLPESVKQALLLHRKTNPKEFLKQYPPVPPGQAHLTRKVTTSNGTPLIIDGSGGSQNLDQSGNIDLCTYPGANTMERAMSCVKATQAGAEKMTFDQLFVAARNFKRQPNVIDSATK